tara:strand:+ start:238 stop:1404 length:1167 start_codon:yes stop_codon:yes gene_type:complete
MNEVQSAQEQTLTIKTAQDILDTMPADVKTQVEHLIALEKIKSDGPLGDIPNRKDKKVIKVSNIWFIVEVQRIDNIQWSNIIKNLREIGGYNHKSAGVLDVFGYESEDIDYFTSPDGMHRLIMALICGVEEVAVNIQDVHAADATNEEIVSAEKQFFDDKNGRSSPISETDKMRSDKLSGKLSAKDKKLDEDLSTAGVRIGDIGASEDDAIYEHDTKSEFDKLLAYAEHPCYVKPSVVYAISSSLVNIIPNGSIGARTHGAIINVINSLESSDDPTLALMFRKWLKATNKYSYRYYDKAWWSGLVQHSRNMENTALRMFCAFNQWYRTAVGENCIAVKDVEKYLKVMNTETKQFVDDCLVKEMTIAYAPVAEMEEEESTEEIDNFLNV